MCHFASQENNEITCPTANKPGDQNVSLIFKGQRSNMIVLMHLNDDILQTIDHKELILTCTPT